MVRKRSSFPKRKNERNSINQRNVSRRLVTPAQHTCQVFRYNWAHFGTGYVQVRGSLTTNYGKCSNGYHMAGTRHVQFNFVAGKIAIRVAEFPQKIFTMYKSEFKKSIFFLYFCIYRIVVIVIDYWIGVIRKENDEIYIFFLRCDDQGSQSNI